MHSNIAIGTFIYMQGDTVLVSPCFFGDFSCCLVSKYLYNRICRLIKRKRTMIYVIYFQGDSGNEYEAEYQCDTVQEAERTFREEFGQSCAIDFIEQIPY